MNTACAIISNSPVAAPTGRTTRHLSSRNGAIVRKIVGYRRFEGLQATRELAKLYSSMRLFINFLQPSFKLKEKHRDGAKVIKRYHPPRHALSAAA